MSGYKPEWYYSQRLACPHKRCGWKSGGIHIFRDNGHGGDGEVINFDVPWHDKCPRCKRTLAGELGGMFWAKENAGSLYIWDERPE